MGRTTVLRDTVVDARFESPFGKLEIGRRTVEWLEAAEPFVQAALDVEPDLVGLVDRERWPFSFKGLEQALDILPDSHLLKIGRFREEGVSDTMRIMAFCVYAARHRRLVESGGDPMVSPEIL